MTAFGGDELKLLWYNAGNFTSEASVKFILQDPKNPIEIDTEDTGDFGNDDFEDESTESVSKTSTTGAVSFTLEQETP